MAPVCLAAGVPGSRTQLTGKAIYHKDGVTHCFHMTFLILVLI